jgi:hypothetical protein
MPTSDSELLARSIRASGLSTGDYARQVLIRDPRQVRRWLAGTLPMPAIVREHLERLEKRNAEFRRLGAVAEYDYPPTSPGLGHLYGRIEERLEDGTD